MYESAKLITSSRPQGYGIGLWLCSSCTIPMSVQNWIMVVLCTIQLENQSLSLLIVCRMRSCALVLVHPVASLRVEAGELPLELRRYQLCIQYVCKLRSNPCNLAFTSVFGTCLWRLFEAIPNTTLGIRLNQTIVKSEINLFSIAINLTPYIPPWVLIPPIFCYPCTYLETSGRFLLL